MKTNSVTEQELQEDISKFNIGEVSCEDLKAKYGEERVDTYEHEGKTYLAFDASCIRELGDSLTNPSAFKIAFTVKG